MADEPAPRRRSLIISAATQRSVRFVAALALLTFEAVAHHDNPQWLLIAIYGTMMGLPIAEFGDEVRRRATGVSRAEEVDDQ